MMAEQGAVYNRVGTGCIEKYFEDDYHKWNRIFNLQLSSNNLQLFVHIYVYIHG